MDHAPLMRVVHRAADSDPELDPRANRQPAFFAVARQRLAFDEVHREERTSIAGDAGVEDARHAGMIHPGQHLALGIEPAQELSSVHTRLDHFERHEAPHWRELLGAEDDAEAALAEWIDHSIVRHERKRFFGCRGE